MPYFSHTKNKVMSSNLTDAIAQNAQQGAIFIMSRTSELQIKSGEVSYVYTNASSLDSPHMRFVSYATWGLCPWRGCSRQSSPDRGRLQGACPQRAPQEVRSAHLFIWWLGISDDSCSRLPVSEGKSRPSYSYRNAKFVSLYLPFKAARAWQAVSPS